MRKALVLTAVLTLVLACSSAFANELVNWSFEDPGVAGWTLNPAAGGYPIEQANQEPQDGGFVARSMKGYYSGMTPDTELYQDVQVAPGIYDVTLSGWVKRYVLDGGYANHPDWGWVTVELTADGNVVASETYSGDDTWHNAVLTWSGYVESYKDVHIRWGLTEAGGGSKSFDVMLADAFVLEETVVPEPASMLVLLGGLAGLAIRRRK